MSFDLNKIKEFEAEIQRREKEERDKKEEEARKIQEEKERVEKEKRHAAWKKAGIVYYKRMLKQEQEAEAFAKAVKAREAAEKAAIEEEKRRKREAQKAEWRRIREEAAREKAERRRKTRWYESGSYYFGDFLEDGVETNPFKTDPRDFHHTPHGEGEFWRPGNDLEYKGEWLHGKMHGWGEFHYSTGKTYTGEFVHGEMHGYGTVQETSEGKKRGAVYWRGKRIAWWDELHEGCRIQIKLPNLGYKTGNWTDATIVQYDYGRKKINSRKRGKEHLIKFEFDIPPPGYKDSQWMNLSRIEFKAQDGLGGSKGMTIGEDIPLRYPIVNTRLRTGRNIPQKRISNLLDNNIEFKKLIRKGFEAEIDEHDRVGKENPKSSGKKTRTPKKRFPALQNRTPTEGHESPSSFSNRHKGDNRNSALAIRVDEPARSEFESKYADSPSNMPHSYFLLADDEPHYSHKEDALKSVLSVRSRLGKKLAALR